MLAGTAVVVVVVAAGVVIMILDDVPSVLVDAEENNKELLVENDKSANEGSLLTYRVCLLEDKNSDLLDKEAVVVDVQVE